MPGKQRIKSSSGYYHIIVRGNESKNIFINDEDKSRFMEILFDKKGRGSFYLHAFCLMDNHAYCHFFNINTAVYRMYVTGAMKC